MPPKHTILIGIISSIFFVFIFLNQLIINLDKPLTDPDNMYQYFLIENNLRKWSSLNFENLYDTRMFYPLKNTLALGNSQFVQSLMSLPVFLLTKDVFISAHAMVLLNFFLTYLVMYFLISHLTKSVPASILGGLIFSYNPYVMAQFYFELLTLFWIPLIFLATEKMLEGKKSWATVLLFLFLGQLISSFYYFAFLILTWPFYLGIRVVGVVRDVRGVGKGGLISLIICLITGAFYLQPYLGMKDSYGMTRDLGNVMFHSATFGDFISTTTGNKLYGFILGNQLRDYTEHSLFAGFVVYGLFITSLVLFFRKKYQPTINRVIVSLGIVWLIAFVLSFGPYFQIGEVLVPNIYLLFYKFVPLFDSLRAPSRFFVMGYFSMAILAGFAVKYWLGKLGRWGRSGVFLSLFLLISLEYQHNLAPPFEIKDETKSFYQWLDQQPQIDVILELPIANELIEHPQLLRSYFDDSKYLLYALDHQKKLINGNGSYNPLERTLLGQSLSINFPSPNKLEQLKEMGVDAIIVHQDEYKNPPIGKIISEKLRMILKEVYKSENIEAFLLEK